ncbi:hypothetical protein EXIGLDRAFT_847483 [Exidia glandulosa HHB12029]|uniref:Protein kinase domain-containing protein n=1 Tax=Exidia glandulosa HHB12029 TaxID=1314781 RepID=A0A166MWI2_EXIGL|nr:hypothetical protein EXIGLDRAFT_847483 [Exidia glandulosa HHB12029]
MRTAACIEISSYNVLLDERCRVKLSDFGFTSEFERGSLLDTFCGTAGYASPEMLLGKKYHGQEVDNWADTVCAPNCVRVDPPNPPVSAYETVRCALHDCAEPGDLLHVEVCALYGPYHYTNLDTDDAEPSLLKALQDASPELQLLFPSLSRRIAAQCPLSTFSTRAPFLRARAALLRS